LFVSPPRDENIPDAENKVSFSNQFSYKKKRWKGGKGVLTLVRKGQQPKGY
jgi:hypothetical protein